MVLENIYHNPLHVLRAGGQTLRNIEIHKHFLKGEFRVRHKLGSNERA